MISVEEAKSLIMGHPWPSEVTKVDLERALGLILAQEVRADRDFPPFDRVTMDGIAISFQALEEGNRNFKVQEIQAAGDRQKRLNQRSECLEVMTGAILPENTDTVIPYEDVVISEDGGGKTSTIDDPLASSLARGQNVHLRGKDQSKGDLLLEPGCKIASPEISVLATVGLCEPEVYAFPKVAVISTGDELVDVKQAPEPHQIRRSNSYSLHSELTQMGVQAQMYHLSDSREDLLKKLASILSEHPVVIVSGGVSKGKYDFVPEVLEELGVRKLFHQVAQRPGKPLWFGVSEENWVFALPGNPVSTFMCFHQFVKPWFYHTTGHKVAENHAVLADEVIFKPDLTYFIQVKLDVSSKGFLATPVPGHGSGDLANLTRADAFLELPRGREVFKKGELYRLLPFRGL